MPIGPGGLDSNGIWQFGEDDSEALASDLLNLGMGSVSTAISTLGGVLQVVSTTKTDTFTMNSSTFTDVTGLSVSITPTSSTSKIFVMFDANLGNQYGTNIAVIRLMRDTTPIFVGTDVGSRTPLAAQAYNRSSSAMTQVGGSTLDAPATTAAVTYKIQLRWQNSGAIVAVNRSVVDSNVEGVGRGASSITVWEVAG